MLVSIGYTEAQRDHIQKAGFVSVDTLSTQVVAGMEHQLVLADRKRITLQDGGIASAIVVGYSFSKLLTIVTVNTVQFDTYPLAGAS